MLAEAQSVAQSRKKMVQAMQRAGIADQHNNRVGSLTPNAEVVLKRRYLSKDRDGNVQENPDGMFRRVARNLSLADLKYEATEEERQATEEEFYQTMKRLELMPNSPTLMNAGRELQQLSACFVLPVEDSLFGIFESVKQTALIHKSGGGTGFAFSHLRPSGDVVGSTGGVASGPVSFMKTFDAATDVVKQGGTRRGANMAILDVTHPDILDFIASKEDGNTLVNFNISVGVNADFMEKVKRGEMYDLVNPRNGVVAGKLNATDVFNLIAEMAWKTGDPGLVFLDAINRDNPNPHMGDIMSTNPCFAGNVRLATDKGLLTFGELFKGKQNISVLTDARVVEFKDDMFGTPTRTITKVANGVALKVAKPVFKTRNNWPVFKLETKHGYEVIATDDHKFYTTKGLKEVHELEIGDEILIQSGKGVWSQDYTLPPFVPTAKLKGRIRAGIANMPTKWSRELGELLGWYVGDGWVSQHLPKGRNVPTWTVGLMFGGSEKPLLSKFQACIKNWFGMDGCVAERHNAMWLSYKSSLYYFLQSLGVDDADGLNKTVPSSLWKAPREAVLGFLSALFSADGSVNISNHSSSCTIRLSSSSKELLKQVQLLLLNEGIVARIHLRRDASERELPDVNRQSKKYQCAAQYELLLDGQSRDAFLSEIGFMAEAKQQKAIAWLNNKSRKSNVDTYTDTVTAIEFYGNEDVYCTTEPETHSIIANGCVTSQCGEQPLLPYESCNLASINLARMLEYSKDDVDIDWNRLLMTIGVAVHMLDNVIDMNEYPIPEIAEMSRNTRRIGLGVMGFADLCVQLGIPYDSEEALMLADKVMDYIQQQTTAASMDLAKKRGARPSSPESGMRHSAPTTIAPTGTISIISGASSGIEPLFALGYERNVMDNTKLREMNMYFEAVARSEGFYSDELMAEVIATGTIAHADVPEWVKQVFRTSHDITPEWHVRMQSAFQRRTDNAVSKTINFPHDATVEDVKTAYMMAYEENCKGITVYRDGSKDNQVLSVGHKEDEEENAIVVRDGRVQPRSRPISMSGKTDVVATGHGKLYVTLNFDDDGMPFEIFGNQGKSGGCNAALMEAVSRMATLCFRAGVDPYAVIEQLQGITCCPSLDNGIWIKSPPDGMAHVLRKHLGVQQMVELVVDSSSVYTNGHSNGNGLRKCHECNGPLVMEEGCEKCIPCGLSKC